MLIIVIIWSWMIVRIFQLAQTMLKVNTRGLVNKETDLVMIFQLAQMMLKVNTRGLVNKQTDLVMLLCSMMQSGRIDVVILVETWLTKESESRINMPGYVYVMHPHSRLCCHGDLCSLALVE